MQLKGLLPTLMSIVIVTILLVMLHASGPVQAGERSGLDETRALAVLTKQLRKDDAYHDASTLRCVYILPVEQVRDFIEFDVREKHGGPCPGDPGIAPRLDSFRVARLDGQIEWLDSVNGEWRPYQERYKTSTTMPESDIAGAGEVVTAQDYFLDSDRRYLTRDELLGLSRDQLRIARNEIYARKGRFFQDASLMAYFSRFAWYQPNTWNPPLNRIEKANVSLIQSMER